MKITSFGNGLAALADMLQYVKEYDMRGYEFAPFIFSARAKKRKSRSLHRNECLLGWTG